MTKVISAYEELKQSGLTAEHLELYLEQEKNKLEAKTGGENNG